MSEDLNQKPLSCFIGQTVSVMGGKSDHPARVTGFEPATRKVKVAYKDGTVDSVARHQLISMDEAPRSREPVASLYPRKKQNVYKEVNGSRDTVEVNDNGDTDSLFDGYDSDYDQPGDNSSLYPRKKQKVSNGDTVEVNDNGETSDSLFDESDSDYDQPGDDNSLATQDSPPSMRAERGVEESYDRDATNDPTCKPSEKSAPKWADTCCKSSLPVGDKGDGGAANRSTVWPTRTKLSVEAKPSGETAPKWGRADTWSAPPVGEKSGGVGETAPKWGRADTWSAPPVGEKSGGVVDGSATLPTKNLATVRPIPDPAIEAALGEGYFSPSQLTFPPKSEKKKKKKVNWTFPFGGPISTSGQKKENTILKYLFGEKRIHVRFAQLSRKQELTLDTEFWESDRKWVLICCKYDKEGDGSGISTNRRYNGPGQVVAYYVREKRSRSIESELLTIANFAKDPANKTATRLELLVTPAKGNNCAGERDWNDFEFIDTDDKYMGCGFIPLEMLQKLCPGAVAIQLRIVSPEGLFKGMLMAKIGISKIQLFRSMKKVGKATEKCKKKLKGKAFLLVSNSAPSQPAILMGQQLNPNLKKPSPSASKELKKKKAKSNPMIKTVLAMNGVPNELIDWYLKEESTRYESCHHCAVYGVSDPTDMLPEGSIFLTGFGVGNVCGDNRVFVTRYPCTEARDGRMLPLVRSQPIGMSDKQWKFLCSLHFGVIIFATPKSPGAKLLPETIANGDLDGDTYTVLWDKEILSHILPTPIFVNDSEDEDASDAKVDDPLVGIDVTLEVDGSHHQGIVKKKKEDGYVVAFENLDEQVWTRQQVFGGRSEVDVTDHRGHGRNKVEVEISWTNCGTNAKSKTWETLATAKKICPRALAEYARAHNLCNRTEWRWTSKHVYDTHAIKLVSHREVNGRVQEFKVRYDNGEDEWEELSVSDRDDLDLIRAYVNDTGEDLLQKDSWILIKTSIEQPNDNWFNELQEYLVNNNRRMDHDQLRSLLHKVFEASTDKREKLYFGRAYKQGLDIGKHGGKVDLPLEYAHHPNLSQKGLHRYIRFI